MYRPKPQEIYRHFKGKQYQVLTCAIHSETGEEMVVYQGLYGDFPIYCRPLWMFVSPVDRLKYPDVEQEYRFELVRRQRDEIRKKPVRPEVPDVLKKERRHEPAVISEESEPLPRVREEHVHPPVDGVMNKSIEEEAKELNLNPLVVAFLDADSPDERLRILDDLHRDITDEQIDLMAMAMDAKIEEGDIYDRYISFRNLLLTKKRFESSRLRG